jgi:signal transduction histidine kinase
MNADLTRSRDLRRQMTADIAHDLRTPLSVILGHSEALKEGILPPSSETFYIIHDEAQRLSRLVDDLRTLSLAEAGELQLTRRPVSPRRMLSRAVTAHAPEAERKNITLALEVDPDVPEVYADPDRMAQVMDNLLSNALRHTPEGGRIELSARSSPPTEGSGGGLRIIIQDSGPGIPADEIPYIFERFYRGDKARQRQEDSETMNGSGSGLGLAIARSVVEAHDGRIWAESQTGGGVTFIIELPLAN